MLSSNWFIISRGLPGTFSHVNSPCSLDNFDFSLNSETQTMVFMKWSGKSFLHQTSSPKKECSLPKPVDEKWDAQGKVVCFQEFYVNLVYFISQVFISVLGNNYMFSIWRKYVHLCFPWHLFCIQTTLQFNADKDFPSHMVCLSNRGSLRMNRENLYYSDFSFCGFCNFPTKLWCLKMTFWKLDLTAWNPMTQNCQHPVGSLEGLVMTACLQLLFQIRINFFRWMVIFLRNATQI